MKRNKNTLLVNIFGAPGASKSTSAALVFGLLKQAGVDCELVRECAKDYVWEGRLVEFENQICILGEQIRRINSVYGKVDVVISDSPILLSIYYNESCEPNAFNTICLEAHSRYNSVNFFLNRTKPYNPNGRFQNESESNNIAKSLRNILNKHDISFIELDGDNSCASKIVTEIFERLDKSKGTAVIK